MTPKELITKIKEYADVADASYAMLHYIEENEVFDIKDDEWKAKYSKEPPARWIYADGIKRGYEISSLTKEAKNNHRSIGQPTAYALSIEAR